MRSLDSALRAPDPQHLEAVLRGAALRDERAAAAEERRRRRELEWAREERARIEAAGSAAAMQGARRSRDLATRFVARLGAASVSTFFLGLSRGTFDYTLDGSAVVTWLDRSGRGNHATQSTSTARPTYSATAVNSRPGMTLGGDDWLITGNINLSPSSAAALLLLFQDSDTAAKIPAEWGTVAGTSSAGGIALITNDAGGGYLIGYGRRNAAANSARSSNTYPMTTPAVVTVTWDLALSTETEIRHGGSNVTSTRPSTGNNTGTLGSAKLAIGARDTGAAPITGAIAACALVAHTGAWSGAALTALADGEAMLAAQQGL